MFLYAYACKCIYVCLWRYESKHVCECVSSFCVCICLYIKTCLHRSDCLCMCLTTFTYAMMCMCMYIHMLSSFSIAMSFVNQKSCNGCKLRLHTAYWYLPLEPRLPRAGEGAAAHLKPHPFPSPVLTSNPFLLCF